MEEVGEPMRRSLLIVAGVVATSCVSVAEIEQEKAALLAADAAFEQSATDIDKFVAHFTPDGALSLHGMPTLKGPDAIRDAIGPLMKAPGYDLSWKATRAEVAASSDLGYTVGTYQMTMNNAAGVPAVDNGKFITTWQKVDGVWKVFDDFANSDAPTPVSSAHVMVPASKLVWGNAPPTLPPGAKLALVSGDPSQPGAFTVRVQFPAGSRVAPHWHPTDEHVTVLSGTIALGLGTTFDQNAMTDLTAGSYAVTPATIPHYALARTAVTFQVHGMGPYVANPVSQADAPPKK